jgi:putative ABC transport system permease protein
MQGVINATVQELDKGVPVYQVSTMEDYVSKSAAQPRFQAVLLASFAGVALVLAALGLYGLLSYLVVQRTHEIGLRMALGAQKSDVLRMIIRRGMTLACVGTGTGLVISVIITRLMAKMLFHVGPTDPLTFATTAVLLFLVSIAASSVPAYRAAGVDPMKTLRDQ